MDGQTGQKTSKSRGQLSSTGQVEVAAVVAHACNECRDLCAFMLKEFAHSVRVGGLGQSQVKDGLSSGIGLAEFLVKGLTFLVFQYAPEGFAEGFFEPAFGAALHGGEW